MKRCICLLLALLTLATTLPFAVAETQTAADGFVYKVVDGEATITDYTGSATELVIPDTLGGAPVIAIGYGAFYYCRLTTVTIPDSVTTIGNEAFSWCNSLTSVTIPNSVTTIGDSAFFRCSGLTSVTIPDSVTTIGDGTFYMCTSLTSVIIPDSVNTIGRKAFSSCWSLTSVIIPDSVTTIGGYAFYDTGYYKDETNWENSVLYIGNHLIKAKEDITGSYVIKEGTKRIAIAAFSSCNSLTSVTIPDSVTTIGASAFSSCWNLTSVIIPDSVTTIGNEAFSCNSLTSVIIPDSVTTIGNEAFFGCVSLTSVTIGNGVTTIGDGGFYECTSLTSVTIPDSVTTIGKCAVGMEIDWEVEDYRPIDGFIICGHPGTAAETYANENGITFVVLDKREEPSQPDEPSEEPSIPEDNVTPNDPEPVVFFGDISGDEKIDASDALVILKAAVGKQDLTADQIAAADVSGDGKVDAVDALLVLKFAVGKIDKFPVQE